MFLQHWTKGREEEAWLEGSRAAGQVAVGHCGMGFGAEMKRRGQKERDLSGPSIHPTPSYRAYSIPTPPLAEKRTLLGAISERLPICTLDSKGKVARRHRLLDGRYGKRTPKIFLGP